MRGLEHYFNLYQHDTTLCREVLAGVITFLSMAYIVFVNPAILSDAGVDLTPPLSRHALLPLSAVC